MPLKDFLNTKDKLTMDDFDQIIRLVEENTAIFSQRMSELKDLSDKSDTVLFTKLLENHKFLTEVLERINFDQSILIYLLEYSNNKENCYLLCKAYLNYLHLDPSPQVIKEFVDNLASSPSPYLELSNTVFRLQEKKLIKQLHFSHYDTIIIDAETYTLEGVRGEESLNKKMQRMIQESTVNESSPKTWLTNQKIDEVAAIKNTPIAAKNTAPQFSTNNL